MFYKLYNIINVISFFSIRFRTKFFTCTYLFYPDINPCYILVLKIPIN